jgi:3-isopropylmalate dehydratase small subunit
VVSTSFADIFYNNCFQNGLLPVVLKAEQVQQLMDEAAAATTWSASTWRPRPSPRRRRVFAFEIDPQRKAKMLQGLDAIGETLQPAPPSTPTR